MVLNPGSSSISLKSLRNYFGDKANSLATIRDKTAFHYDKLNLNDAVNNLADLENNIYLAQHPANSLYYIGSAIVFRTAFALIADKTQDTLGRSHGERTGEGVRIATKDAMDINWHMHALLYGLIQNLLEEALACPLSTVHQVRLKVCGAPKPDNVGLPTLIDIGGP